MRNYDLDRGSKRKWPKAMLVVGAIALALLVIGVLGVRHTYEENLRPVGASQRAQQFTVPSGASVQEIGANLEEAGLIRAAWAFEWYIRTNSLQDAMIAGTYSLRPNQSINEIVSILTQGKISTDLVTILPGQRLGQIHQGLVNFGFNEAAVERALNPELHDDHPALVDKPVGASLEGYIYPESFHKTADTTPDDVIRASLDEMQEYLTPQLRTNIVRQGLTVHEGVVLASIIEQEVSNPEDKEMVAQVFLKRLNDGMRLESDPTAIYGAIVNDVDLPSDPAAAAATAIRYESRHNTYYHKGLPPTPISNVTKSSLEAVANPANTDYLFFVGGDDGKTYFSRTLSEHERLTREHCTKLCN